MSSASVDRDRWRPVWREIVPAAAVLTALAVLASIALWGMAPLPAPATSNPAVPSVSAPAAGQEPDGGDGG